MFPVYGATEAFIDADTLSASLPLVPNATLLLLHQTTFRCGLGKIFIQVPYQVLISQNHSAGLLQGGAADCRKIRRYLACCVSRFALAEDSRLLSGVYPIQTIMSALGMSR